MFRVRDVQGRVVRQQIKERQNTRWHDKADAVRLAMERQREIQIRNNQSIARMGLKKCTFAFP
jgi:hypothetical protein